MRKILIPTDGSELAERAVRQVIELVRSGAELEIHLLNVQLPIESGHVKMFFEPKDVIGYQQEEGEKELASARQLLAAAGLSATSQVAVGHPATAIIQCARDRGIDTIIMGTHGRSGLLEVLLGSVAREVLQQSTTPLLLVK